MSAWAPNSIDFFQRNFHGKQYFLAQLQTLIKKDEVDSRLSILGLVDNLLTARDSRETSITFMLVKH